MADDSTPSELRDGRYAVTKLLGEGGQASSYQAVDKREGRLVVVKRFRVRGAKSWKEVELAEREAKVLSGLHHESLPRYVDHFEEGGELFLVTEYIEGESLAALRKRGERLGEADVARFLETAAKALDYLHGLAPPVVHRDIKPSNVLRRPDGSFAIIDFGAVRDRMKPEGGSTVVGTFGYMAPEQFQGRASPASDVYAVAATALVMLTGVEPEDLPHKGLAIDVAKSLQGRRAAPWLVAALSKMLEPDPDTRAARITPLLGRDARRGEPAPSPGPGPNPWPFRDEREERRAARRERHEQRRQRRAERRAERRAARGDDWVRGYGRPLELGGAVAWFVRMGLLVAQIAVRVSLLVVVVPILIALSWVFGRELTEAAEEVRRAEREAQDEIRRARAYTIEKPAPAAQKATDPRVRVAPGPSPEERRARDEAADLEAEAEAEAEEAARGAARGRSRTR